MASTMRTNYKLDFILGIIAGGFLVTCFYSREVVNTHEYYEAKLPKIARSFYRTGCYAALNNNKPLQAIS